LGERSGEAGSRNQFRRRHHAYTNTAGLRRSATFASSDAGIPVWTLTEE
jgi:hypothetical protein